MKIIKKYLKLLPILLFILFFGCKKDEKNKNITAADLENYYIVGQRKLGNSKLLLVYFSKEGNAMKANFHIRGGLRVAPVNITNNKLIFDYNNDNAAVYTFELEKGASGDIKLKTFQFINNTDVNQGLDYAILVKKSDSPTFTNSYFVNSATLIKVTAFSELDWDIKSRQIGVNLAGTPVYLTGPEFSAPIYDLLNLGFKSKNDQFIGLSVPYWKNITTPILLVERDGDNVNLLTKQ